MGIGKLFTTRGVILLALTATVVLSFFSYRSVQKLNLLAGLVDHTHVVQLNLQRTFVALSEADSELKAYLITKDSVYYRNLMREEHAIRQCVTSLKTLTRDNQTQLEAVIALDSLIHSRWTYMAASIKADESDYDLYSAKIEECNQFLKKAIHTLNDREEELLLARSERSSRYQSTAPLPLFALQVVIALCLMVGFFRVTEDLRTKERLQKETSAKNKELKQQRDFIQGIFDNTVDVMFIFDPDLNIVAMNNRARELYETKGALLGKNLLDIFPQAKGSDSVRGIRDALNGKHTHSRAIESVVYHGTFYESFFVPLYSEDKITGAMSIHHDVSDLMKMTSDIRAINQQLQKSNEELEQFAYVTSHDLQEPLRKIRTFADIAKRNIDNAEIVSRNLEKLTASAERMSQLIKDVLNYSRLSTTDPNTEEVDLNQILDQVLQDLELTISERKAVVESGHLPTVLGSRQQLTQVVANIIGNALKFCKSTPCVKVDCIYSDKFLTLTFTDNGIGFEQKYADQIFGVFQRLHHSSEFGGTGIGLALCKRIVENHGGSMKATSVPNHGTTIYVTLPRLANPSGNRSPKVSYAHAIGQDS